MKSIFVIAISCALMSSAFAYSPYGSNTKGAASEKLTSSDTRANQLVDDKVDASTGLGNPYKSSAKASSSNTTSSK